MNKTCLGIIACIVSSLTLAQNRTVIDSLNRELLSATSEEVSAKIRFELNSEWAEFSFDSSMRHAKEGVAIALALDDPKLISLGYSAIGLAHDYAFQLDSAVWYYAKARDISTSSQDSVGMVKAIFNLGNMDLMTGKLDDALDKYQQAFALYELMEDRLGQARAWNNQALIYRRTKQYGMAKKALKEAIRIYEDESRPKKKYNALTNLASAHLILEEYDSAISTAKEDMEIAKSLQNPAFMLQPLVVIGQSYEKLTEGDSSFYYYSKANEMVGAYTPASAKTYVYFGLATYFLNKDQHRPAKPYLDLLEELGTVEKNLDLAISYYEMTAKYHRLSGNLERAYSERLKHEEMKEKYHDQQLIERTTELEQIFEKEKRELEIAKLQAENDKKAQQTQALIVITSLSVIALIFLVVLFRQRHLRNRLQQQLLHEEINGLRLRLSKVFSEVKLEALDTKVEEIQTAFHNKLTEREAEILQLAVTNKTNAEIADEVHLSVNTVKYHMKNIYNKIGVSSRLEARQVMVSG